MTVNFYSISVQEKLKKATTGTVLVVKDKRSQLKRLTIDECDRYFRFGIISEML